MHNDVVHRNAESRGETLISFAQGYAAIVADELLAYFVKVSSGNTRLNMTAHLGKSLAEETGTITYQFYFFFCLKEYHSK